MTVTLLTVIIICICNCVYLTDNHESSGTPDDMVECVFNIDKNSALTIYKPTQNDSCTTNFIQTQYLQNIGYTDVMVKGLFSVTVEPCHSWTFFSPVIVHNINSSSRALVYVSDCEEMEKHYQYYENNVLRETFSLGVKFISREGLNIDKLILHFWPQNKSNVWQQLYDTINHLLEDKVRSDVSGLINITIKNTKEDLYTLTKNLTKSDFKEKYLEIGAKLLNRGNPFIMWRPDIRSRDLSNFYISPLYSNYVTLQMYYFLIGYEFSPEDVGVWIQNLLYDTHKYIKAMDHTPIERLHQTVYPGCLYNVMMNTRSHFTVHVLEMVSVWERMYESVYWDYEPHVKKIYPLSYSKLYGKATPNLLQEAMHIKQSPLFAQYDEYDNPNDKLNKIFFYIKTKRKLKTVYGLTLKFSSNSSKNMGTTTKFALNIQVMELNLENRKIMELTVYKTNYIRCLQFILSTREEVTFGNNCSENSVSSTFKFKGHYIHSLYLANDYLDTKNYFDNVAVSYLPLNS